MTGKRALARVLCVLVLMVILVAVLLPNHDLAWMREHWRWFHRPMLWIEATGGPINLVHFALFAVLGAVVRLGWPATTWRNTLGGFLLVGAATEVAQLWIPGRDPRVSDIFVDVAAGMLGWWSAILVCLALRTLVKA